MSDAARGAAIPVVPIGPVAAGAVAWRRRGQLHVTVIVKATFAFAVSARMKEAPPSPLALAEAHHSGSPVYSIRTPADLAPLRERCDVLFAGHAHAPPGEAAPRLVVRLAVYSAQGAALCDKRLEIVGERVSSPGAPPPAPRPFERMSLTYERAYGGPGHADNPLGVGVLTSSGRRTLPNVLHPDPPPRAPVNPPGLAPISALWPVRRRMLTPAAGKALEQAIAEVPDDLPDVYFQAAPADQRIAFLEGDEWIVLHGLHPTPELRFGLPSARGLARVYSADGASRPLALHGDTLLVDGDAGQCSITWRGSFPVEDEAALAGLAAAAGVETLRRPVVFPDRLDAGAPPPARPAITTRAAFEPTVALGGDDGDTRQGDTRQGDTRQGDARQGDSEEAIELSLRSVEILSAPTDANARTQPLPMDANARTQPLPADGPWAAPPKAPSDEEKK